MMSAKGGEEGCAMRDDVISVEIGWAFFQCCMFYVCYQVGFLSGYFLFVLYVFRFFLGGLEPLDVFVLWHC